MLKITVKGILDSKTASQLKLENQSKRFAQAITLQQDEYLSLPVKFQNRIKREPGNSLVLDLTQISLAAFALDLGGNSLRHIGSRALTTDPTRWSTQREFIAYCIELDRVIDFNAKLSENAAITTDNIFDPGSLEFQKLLPHLLYVQGQDNTLLNKFAEQGLAIKHGEFQYENGEVKSIENTDFEKFIKSKEDADFELLFEKCLSLTKTNCNETVKYSTQAISIINILERNLQKKYWGAIKNSFIKQIEMRSQPLEEIKLPSVSNPSFISVTAKLNKILSIAKKYGSRPKIRPILLVGTPGCGKTKFAKRLARSLSDQYIYIPSNARSSGFLLSGLDITWKNSQPGEIARAVIASPNEIIPVVVDEIDKASDDIIAPLYQLLEKESAASFIDEFLKFPIDATNIFFIATANSIDQMNSAILDRFTIFDCPMHSPSVDDCIEIMNEIKASYGLPENIKFNAEIFHTLISEKKSFRQIYEAIEDYILAEI